MREDLNSLLRRTRIVSGFILFFYAATHLLNHSLATFSISTADAARHYFHAFWCHPIPEIFLYASFALHILLGIQAVLTRKSFKMTKREWLQMTFPFVALLALIPHVLTNKILASAFDVKVNYELLSQQHCRSVKSIIQRNFLFADGRAHLDTRCYWHTWTLADQTTLRSSTSNHHRILLGSSNSCVGWVLFRAQRDEFHHLRS